MQFDLGLTIIFTVEEGGGSQISHLFLGQNEQLDEIIRREFLCQLESSQRLQLRNFVLRREQENELKHITTGIRIVKWRRFSLVQQLHKGLKMCRITTHRISIKKKIDSSTAVSKHCSFIRPIVLRFIWLSQVDCSNYIHSVLPELCPRQNHRQLSSGSSRPLEPPDSG